eukprot:ANDGO_01215.mRNA.1 CCR4-NOT transcription complex subunit 11
MDVYAVLDRHSVLSLSDMQAALRSYLASVLPASPVPLLSSASSVSDILVCISLLLQDRFLDTPQLRIAAHVLLYLLCECGGKAGAGAHYVLYSALQQADRLGSALALSASSTTSNAASNAAASSASSSSASSANAESSVSDSSASLNASVGAKGSSSSLSALMEQVHFSGSVSGASGLLKQNSVPNSPTAGSSSNLLAAAGPGSGGVPSSPTSSTSAGTSSRWLCKPMAIRLHETLAEEYFLLLVMMGKLKTPGFSIGGTYSLQDATIDGLLRAFSRPLLDGMLASLDTDATFVKFVQTAESEKAHSLLGFEASAVSPFLVLAKSPSIHRSHLSKRQLRNVFADKPSGGVVSSGSGSGSTATTTTTTSAAAAAGTSLTSAGSAMLETYPTSAAGTTAATLSTSLFYPVVTTPEESFLPQFESVASHFTLDEVLQSNTNPNAGSTSPKDNAAASASGTANTMFSQRFRPSWVTLMPPVMDPLPTEMQWSLPTIFPHNAVWDDNIPAEMRETRLPTMDLLKKAFKSTLVPSQTQQVVEDIDAAFLKKQVAVVQEKMPELVEHNPNIAAHVLEVLGTVDAKLSESMLEGVIKMPMSLHVIEVVNRLITNATANAAAGNRVFVFPRSLLFQFLSNCVASCERTPDPYMQTRLVRLLCVFAQSLLRNKIVLAQQVAPELMPFCVQFSRVADAQKLYESLASLQRPDTV